MPTEEKYKPFLIVDTEDLKVASDYSGLDFGELLSLDCVSYKMLFRDAFIYKLKQSKEGQEYLEYCWILEQTKPDRGSLRNKFKGGGDKC